MQRKISINKYFCPASNNVIPFIYMELTELLDRKWMQYLIKCIFKYIPLELSNFFNFKYI